MSIDRTPRSTETREKTERRKPWKPPSALDAPLPPEGFKYRWIRMESYGVEDRKNVSARTREGWVPVKGSDHPDFDAPVMQGGKYDGVITVGGLILMKIPLETTRERTAYYAKQNREAMQAVDNNLMREQHPSMPFSKERRSDVTFGGGEFKKS